MNLLGGKIGRRMNGLVSQHDWKITVIMKWKGKLSTASQCERYTIRVKMKTGIGWILSNINLWGNNQMVLDGTR